MTAVALRFLAGRFHATPWGHHVNEGVPEWPPSPWRLLRALVATAKRTMPELPDERLAELMWRLAAPPHVMLPPACPGMSRHWMPWFKKGPRDRTLVFDSFLALDPRAEVVFFWPGQILSEAERDLLSAILAGLTYFGRAESWAEARLVEDPDAPNCVPVASDRSIPADAELVEVLAPADTDTPMELLRALLVDTGAMRSSNRLVPAGSRWVTYARPFGAVWTDPVPRPLPAAAPPVHLIRFALSGKPLPPLTDALRVGELARRAVLKVVSQTTGETPSPVLTGHDLPADVQHQHAHFLPEDRDADGRIDHLSIWIPAGLDLAEARAVLRGMRLFRNWHEQELELLLEGYWSAGELGANPGVVGCSAVWESETPYVLTRFPKRTRTGVPKLTELGEQRDGPEDQVRREWALRRAADPSLPELVRVERVPYLERGSRTLRWIQFRRWRETGGGPATGMAFGLRLYFAAPVRGPLALGYACHYGLGQFRPVIV